MSIPILSVENLTKTFGHQVAINNVSFNVYEGEIFGLLGPINSGKSAILRAITGSLVPDKGTIKVNDISYKENYIEAAKNISGFITLPKLYNYLNGLKNMRLLAGLHEKYADSVIVNAAQIVGIEHLLKVKARTYSLAERQKLCIAIAIATDPKLIIMDDPFAGLNAKELKDIQDLIKHLANKYKITFIISSQMLGHMEDICTNIAIINNGTILETRSMESLKMESIRDSKLAFTVDYPNYAGKIIHNEFKCRVQLCGSKILAYISANNKEKILDRLKSYKITVFKTDVVTKSLQQLFEEVLQQKAINKSWIGEYN